MTTPDNVNEPTTKSTIPFTTIEIPQVPSVATDTIETVQEAVMTAPQSAAKAWAQVAEFAGETRTQVVVLAKDARVHVTKLATDARLQAGEFASDAKVQATEFAAEARKASGTVAQGASRTVVLIREAVGL